MIYTARPEQKNVDIREWVKSTFAWTAGATTILLLVLNPLLLLFPIVAMLSSNTLGLNNLEMLAYLSMMLFMYLGTIFINSVIGTGLTMLLFADNRSQRFLKTMSILLVVMGSLVSLNLLHLLLI